MPIVKCDYCGKEKELKDYDAKRSKTHFCSNECKSNYQKKQNHIVLLQDNKTCEMHIKDQKVLFDVIDLEKIQQYKWTLKFDKTINNYYVRAHNRNENWKERKSTSIHRLIMSPIPDGMVIDHISRQTLDNRRCNLRVVTQQENSKNKGFYKNNKSGYKYVHFHNAHKRWVVEIKINGKAKYIGSSKDLQKAIQIRDKFLKEVMPICNCLTTKD